MSTFREDARNAFVRAIQIKAPAVLDDLADAPAGAFAELPETLRGGWRWRAEAQALRDALGAWATRWHLSAGWCLETAIATLRQARTVLRYINGLLDSVPMQRVAEHGMRIQDERKKGCAPRATRGAGVTAGKPPEGFERVRE